MKPTLMYRPFVTLLTVAMFCGPAAAQTNPVGAIAPGVDVNAAIGAQPALRSERHDCLIEPHSTIAIGTEAQGVIDRVLVQEGDTVALGQPLVTLKDSVEQANFEQARDRARMTSELLARQADLALAEQKLARVSELLEQNLVPQQEYDEAKASHDVAMASLRHARDNARIADHELARFSALLAQRTVSSPIDGVVLRQHSQPGELVTDMPVLTIAKLDLLRIRAIFRAEHLRQFSPGDPAVVYPETRPEHPIAASVLAVDPVLDPASGTFGVQLLMNNRDLGTVAGQECVLQFVNPLDQPADGSRAASAYQAHE